MEQIPIQVAAQGPLAFPTRKPGTQFRASLPFVPGAALFGALGQILQARGSFDLALLRAIRCHNAYPAATDDQWVRPLPATAIQPKGGEALEDALYDLVCWECQAPVALVYAPTSNDGRAWEVRRGFYTRGDEGALELRTVSQRTLTRVGINRRRGTAEDQRLYSFLALSEVHEQAEARYLGSLSCPAEHAATLRDALAEVTHLGGRQTTGIGAVQIEALPTDKESAATIHGRVATMTARFQALSTRYQSLGGGDWPGPAGSLFTVNLLSDAILYEHGWLPTVALSEAQLEERTGIRARLVRAFTTPSMSGGWQVIWQRPKATETSVAMGGLYLFQTEQLLTLDECERLLALQRDGIGERRAEGYGQVRICDSFHLPATEESR